MTMDISSTAAGDFTQQHTPQDGLLMRVARRVGLRERIIVVFLTAATAVGVTAFLTSKAGYRIAAEALCIGTMTATAGQARPDRIVRDALRRRHLVNLEGLGQRIVMRDRLCRDQRRHFANFAALRRRILEP